MFSNFKIKIIAWYSLLLTAILAIALFGSYKFVGYQYHNEIANDIKAKSTVINDLMKNGVQVERELSSEHGEKRHEEVGEHSSRKYNYSDLQLYTEIADDNYILFVYKNGRLDYLTRKYSDLPVSRLDIIDKEIRNVNFEDISFSMTAIHVGSVSIYFGYELSTLFSLQQRLMNIFLIVLPIGILLSIMCGIFVTQRSLRVINKIGETSKRISTSNLSERIDIPKGNDEITSLISTLNSMIDRLESSFIKARQLSQDTAHEIRTPLTIIRGEVEALIEDDKTNNASAKKLEEILEEVQYISSISNRLLLMHINDTKEIKYNFEKINLSELMESIYQDALVIANDRDLDIKLKIEDNIKLEGNKELITRLLWNLTDNAIKYNKVNGSIDLTLQQIDGKIMIMIKDGGIGIPQEEIEKIFDRFYRVDKSRSREQRGSGLGLAICKWIADLHHAEILVESKLDKGSLFTILF